MDWVKVETSFPRHPKLERLSDAAKWWYLELWCHAAEFETDGLITAKVAKRSGKARATESLKVAGLLTPTPNGNYHLEGFLEHNPSKTTLQAKRRATRDRVQRHRNAVTPSVTDQPVTPLQDEAVTPFVTPTEVEVEVEVESYIPKAVDVSTDEDDPSRYEPDPFLNGQPTAPVLNLKEIA